MDFVDYGWFAINKMQAAIHCGLFLVFVNAISDGLVEDKQTVFMKYFRMWNVNTILYVTCPEEESDFQTFEVIRNFIDHGFTVGVHKHKSAENFTIALHTHNIGILMNSACPDSELILHQAETNNYFSVSYFWIITEPSLKIALEQFQRIFVSPCSYVMIAYPVGDEESSLKLIYLYRAAHETPLRIQNASSLLHDKIIPTRNNLENIDIHSGMVIAFPEVFTTIDDLKMRHIDTMAKVNFPITTNLREDLNFKFDIVQVDNFGWRGPNGTFNGMVGRFQRKEVDMGNSALFMRLERIAVIDFAAETVRFRACIMFRQPPLSAVANIFAMPFTGRVWLSILAFMIITIIAMNLLVKYSSVLINMSVMDCMNFVLGAVCQQGFYADIVARSGRILIFSTFVTSLFLFTSFSANIVALLQSPSETIQTLLDLTLSPLEIGVQDTQYNKVYFKESTDPVTKRLYEKKISPRGESVFMLPASGISRMRNELFAFQIESQTAYKIISDTYNEAEKCGLKELEPFQLPPMGIPLRKTLPYKELFRQRLRWQREIGLISREAMKWIHQKPQCENKFAGFVSVGLTESRYPLQMLGFGMMCSVIIFIAECIYYKVLLVYRTRNMRRVAKLRHWNTK